MRLKTCQRRCGKKFVESVMDDKFALLFKSTFEISTFRIDVIAANIFTIANLKKHSFLIIQVWVMSVPVVVIVHGSQEPQSLATITWDNAFSNICRVQFYVVNEVNWSQMVTALNMKFSDETGRELTPENLDYLCE